jgi:DNA-nicking Smr family endonuclease
VKRTLRPEEARLWSLVAATVRPVGVKAALAATGLPASATPPTPMALPVEALSPRRPKPPAFDPDRIEPNRRRRIARERDPIGGRLDLHGYDQERARGVLHAFIERAHADGARAVLVITGKGARGDGILRRRVPEWLAEPPSRAIVAGLSPAERHHGGDGALYVALKRRGR